MTISASLHNKMTINVLFTCFEPAFSFGNQRKIVKVLIMQHMLEFRGLNANKKVERPQCKGLFMLITPIFIVSLTLRNANSLNGIIFCQYSQMNNNITQPSKATKIEPFHWEANQAQAIHQKKKSKLKYVPSIARFTVNFGVNFQVQCSSRPGVKKKTRHI